MGSQLGKLNDCLLDSPCEILLALVSRDPARPVGEGLEMEVELREEGLVLRERKLGSVCLQWTSYKRRVGHLHFLLSGYALDPSLDSHQVSAKYIGSVEEAEKNQGNIFEVGNYNECLAVTER